MSKMRHSNDIKDEDISFVQNIDRELIFYVGKKVPQSPPVFPDFYSWVQAKEDIFLFNYAQIQHHHL